MSQLFVAGGATVVIALIAPMNALAHGLAGRSDLPIPGWLFGWAAAAVLAVSFFALALLWQSPKLETAVPRARFRFPRAVEIACGLVGVAALAGLVYAGFKGSQAPSSNVVPAFVYVFFWSSLPAISAVFGDVFRAFNPWRAIGRASGWTASKLFGEQLPPPFDYPAKLGRWPAVAGLLGFGWLELVSNSAEDPSTLATLILVYAIVQLIGMAMFGVETWLDRGDAFNFYFGIFARISPFTVSEGRLATRPPLSAITEIEWRPGTVTFLCATIGITAFDGASEGAFFQDISQFLQRQFEAIGFDIANALQAAFTTGMILSVVLIAGLYRAGIAGMRSSHIDRTPSELSRMFAPSLVPIVLAYVLAHYFSFVVFEGQALWALLSNPLGDGSDLFGTAGVKVDYGLLSPGAIWYFQVSILVLGHVAALALAHDKALAVWGKARDAVRSQLWMLVVMVGFTNLGLWLLSQANQ